MKTIERVALYLLCLLNVGFVFQQFGLVPTGQWQSLRTKNLEIVDDKGRTIATLGPIGDYGGKLILKGYTDDIDDRKSQVLISAYKDGSALAMHGYNSKIKKRFGGATILVSEAAGGGRISVAGVSTGYEGNPHISMGPMEGYDLEPGQYLQIKDKKDNWYVPEAKLWKSAEDVKKGWRDAGLFNEDGEMIK